MSDMKLSEEEQQEMDEFQKQILNSFLNEINLNVIFTLPVKPGKHNASEVRDNGYTLVWNLVPGTKNKIYVEATTPNTKNLLLTGLTVIILSGILYLVVKKKKDEKSTNIT